MTDTTYGPQGPDATSETIQPAKAIARLLAEARMRLGLDIAFVSEFAGGRRVFRHVQGSSGSLRLVAGEGDPLEVTYCARVVAGTAPQVMRDAQTEPSVADVPATRDLGIGGHVSVPIIFSNGRLYGTLCVFSQAPNASLGDRDVEVLRMMAALIVEQLEIDEMRADQRQQAIARIHGAMRAGGLTTVFQPVVRLTDGSLAFVEALSRFHAQPLRTPDQWFAEAWSVGLGPDLELRAVQCALDDLDRLPPDVKMSFNLSPETALGSSLLPMLNAVECSRLIVEITEHAVVADYDPLRAVLQNLRDAGVSIAIDDVGAGHSGLQALLELKPDVLKLDVSITSGLDVDPLRYSLADAVATFASASGLETVAEGVETRSEADALRDLRIACAQGYLFGRPGGLDSLRELRPHRVG